ncbi:MAG: hypothetical protein BroJett025_11400 [Patescibacteria group bacterium]|nr:MAG: hypothetical protein BroJett025_11400 [Patescibacteria group bacterium]
MQTTRTTVRLQKPLQIAAKKQAQELDISFQTLVTRALEAYLNDVSQKKAREIIFRGRNIGAKLDNLTREDIYAD